jgi:hypothetical protein
MEPGWHSNYPNNSSQKTYRMAYIDIYMCNALLPFAPRSFFSLFVQRTCSLPCSSLEEVQRISVATLAMLPPHHFFSLLHFFWSVLSFFPDTADAALQRSASAPRPPSQPHKRSLSRVAPPSLACRWHPSSNFRCLVHQSLSAASSPWFGAPNCSTPPPPPSGSLVLIASYRDR